MAPSSTSRPTPGQARPVPSDAGITVVEVMVAALILVIGSIAVLSAVDTAARSTFRAEQSQVVVNRLQEELEQIRELPFDEVALTGIPTHDANQKSPNSRVSGTNFAIGHNGSGNKPMVYNGGPLDGGGTISGATVAPGPTPFDSGDVHGEIYRYVVWLDDATCPEALCPGSQDTKRVIVAALLDGTTSAGQQAYQEIHADLVDPDTQPVDNALPPGGEQNPPQCSNNADDDNDTFIDFPDDPDCSDPGDGDEWTPGHQDPPPGDQDASWQFWLTDTPCNFNSRQPIIGEHLTHNTLGTCGNGLRTGTTAGAPDLMFTEAPPLDSGFPPDSQPLFDYATDVEPTSGAGADRGLQMKSPSGLLGQTGCLPMNLGGLTETNKQWKVHRWLSPAIPSGYNPAGVLLNGHGSLSLWTQTINGAVHPGDICVWLFTRHLNVLGIPVDTPVINLDLPGAIDHFPYSQPSWPSGNWGEIEIPMHFAALNLLPTYRLGLAIGVNRNGTLPGDGLQFNYDTPSFDSRLEVQTTSNGLPF
jgi:hypothetical protein